MCHINAYDNVRGKTYAQLSFTTNTSADHETGVSFPFWGKNKTKQQNPSPLKVCQEKSCSRMFFQTGKQDVQTGRQFLLYGSF